MKQIYDFEQHHPPVLNESILRTKLEQRRLRWQAAWIAFAGLLMQGVLVLLGLSVAKEFSVVTYLCGFYVFFSAIGGSILAIVYTEREGLS